jgi:hypothetical protein
VVPFVEASGKSSDPFEFRWAVGYIDQRCLECFGVRGIIIDQQ